MIKVIGTLALVLALAAIIWVAYKWGEAAYKKNKKKNK